MRRGFVRRYILAFGDQGLTALLSLGVALWLIRRGAPAEFGAHVFWSTAALVVANLTASLTSVYLHPLRPAPLAGRRNMERTLLAATLLLAALAAALTLAALPLLGPALSLWGAALVMPGTLIGIYARILAVSRAMVGWAFGISAVVFLVVSLGLLGAAGLGWPATANQALVLGGLAQGLAGGVVLVRLSFGMGFGAPGGAWRRWRVLLRHSGWPAAGGVAGEISTRFYIFLVTAWFGPVVMGSLAAAQTLLRPATLLAGAWSGAARSTLAQRHHAGDVAGFRRVVLLGCMGPALATLALGGGLAWMWPFVSRWVFGGQYADLAGVLLLWTLVMGLACFVFAFGIALQAMGRLRDAARADIASAGFICVSMPLLLLALPAWAALLSMLLAALLQVTLQWRALRA